MLSSLIPLISPQTFVDHFRVRVYFYGIHKLLVKNKQTNKTERLWEERRDRSCLRSWYETVSHCILGWTNMENCTFRTNLIAFAKWAKKRLVLWLPKPYPIRLRLQACRNCDGMVKCTKIAQKRGKHLNRCLHATEVNFIVVCFVRCFIFWVTWFVPKTINVTSKVARNGTLSGPYSHLKPCVTVTN